MKKLLLLFLLLFSPLTVKAEDIPTQAPTGDNMNNTLKLFALSMLGLGFVLLKRKDLSNE